MLKRILLGVTSVIVILAGSLRAEAQSMETFYLFVTLSSLTGPQVLFVSQPQQWTNRLECSHILPKIEGAVHRIIRYDASALELFGTLSGTINGTYFITTSECMSGGLPTQPPT